MFVPALTSTGLPLIHSFTVSGAAGVPIWPPHPRKATSTAITTASETARLFIIPREFVAKYSLAQVPNSSANGLHLTFYGSADILVRLYGPPVCFGVGFGCSPAHAGGQECPRSSH